MADRTKGSQVTGDERDKIATDLKKRYDGGESVRSLAESTGRSYGYVHRSLTESGTTMRSRGGAHRGTRAETKPKAKAK